MKLTQIPLLLRTVRHVPASQLYHRVRLRTQRAFYARSPNGLEEAWADDVPVDGKWPDQFVPIDWSVLHEQPQRTQHGRGEITMVGETHDVFVGGWRPAERTQLYRYHLHYFEWAWRMAADPTPDSQRDFAELWRAWRQEAQAGRWDEWSPYVVAVRSWVLCGVFEQLVRGTDIEQDVLRVMRASLGYLERNLELDVGGNHLVKDLKGIIGLAAFFGEIERLCTAVAQLKLQVARQILGDGGHYEMSASYHAQVMADLLDISALCRSKLGESLSFIDDRAQDMANWLGAMSYPNGLLPLIGDCTPPPAGLLQTLRALVPPRQPKPLEVLRDTGYVAIRPRPDVMAVFDFGPPCPPELPAHAQADWGTFELWIDGARVIADPAVSTYAGAQRQWERSTAAHNTICVDGQDQSEVWGSFRCARRAVPGPISAQDEVDRLSVRADLTTADGIRLARLVEMTPTELRITDESSAPALARLHVQPTATGRVSGRTIRAERQTIANGFGRHSSAAVLKWRVDGIGAVTTRIDLSANVASSTSDSIAVTAERISTSAPTSTRDLRYRPSSIASGIQGPPKIACSKGEL